MHKLIKEIADEIESSVERQELDIIPIIIEKFIPKIRSEMQILLCTGSNKCKHSGKCEHSIPHKEQSNCRGKCLEITGSRGRCIDGFEIEQ